mgnify:CR=1 FL=1
MRGWGSVVLLLLVAQALEAAELAAPPRLAEEPVDEQRYLHELYTHHNVVVITTTNPNGAITKRAGSLLLYNNGGSYKLCLNVSTTGAENTWRCSANALTAP